MLYEAYERKIERRQHVKGILYKYRILIAIIASLTLTLISTFMFTKGMIYGVSYDDVIEYGDQVDLSSKSLFTNHDILYSIKGENDWGNIKPIYPGNYEIKVLSRNVFNSERSKIFDLEIKPMSLNVFVQEDEVEFGTNPILDFKLVGGDYIDYDDTIYSYEKPTERNSIIKLEKLVIRNRNDEDVTKYYNVSYTEKNIEFIERELGLRPSKYKNIYDGTSHISSDFDVVSGSLAPGHYAKVTTVGSLINVGTTVNKFEEVVIYDEFDNDVTINYNLTLLDGEIEVTKRDIFLKLEDLIKTYDGTKLTTNNLSDDHKEYLVDGHIASAQSNISRVNFGVTFNEAQSYKIMDNDVDVTSNYNVRLEKSKLEIQKRDITIKTATYSKIYDGEALTNLKFDEEEAKKQLVKNDVIEVSVTYPEIFNAGVYDNKLTAKITSEDSFEDNYNINYDYGEVVINKKEINVKTSSAVHTYNATNQQYNYYTILDDELLDRDVVKIENDNTFINVELNPYENKFSLNISSKDDENSVNYEIAYEYGTITIIPKEVIFQANKIQKEYDGLVLKNSSNDLTLESLSQLFDNHKVQITTTKELIDVGFIGDNQISDYIIYDENEEDITRNYLVTTLESEIIITQRPINVKPTDKIKAYDGLKLISEDFDYVSGSKKILDDHEITFNTTEFVLNVEKKYNNLMVDIVITDEYSNDKTSNYFIQTAYGMLEVYQKDLTIITGDDSKVYDDEYFENNDYTLEGKLLDGHFIETSSNTTYIYADTYQNDMTIKIIDGNAVNMSDRDVTRNYNIIFLYGTLTIEKREITISPLNLTKEYDAVDLENLYYQYKVVDSSLYELVDGHILGIYTSEKFKDVDRRINKITDHYIYIGSDLTNVTDNYLVYYEEATIEITHRELSIQTGSSSKEYDNTKLISGEHQIIGGSLVLNHLIEITEYAFIVNVDEIDNDFKFIITEDGVDVTRNYDLSGIKYGTLRIDKRKIIIAPTYLEKIYDAEVLSSDSTQYDILEGSLVLDQQLFIATAGAIKDVGTVKNLITGFNILSDGNSVADNYDVILLENELKVLPRPVRVKAVDRLEQYSGYELRSNVLQVLIDNPGDFDLVSGHTSEILTDKFILNVGVITNNSIVSIEIFERNENVTSNYIFDFVESTLEIIPREITIRTPFDTKVYDGKNFININYEITSGDLTFNSKLNVVSYAEDFIDAGEYTNILGYEIIDIYNGEDITYNYNISDEISLLVILKLDIEVKLRDISKVYDGDVLSSKEYDLLSSSKGLVKGQFLSIETISSMVNVGKINNEVISRWIIDEDNNDQTHNYTIEIYAGYLEITPYEIYVKSKGYEVIYTGARITYDYVDVIGNQLIDGERIIAISNTNIIDAGIYKNDLNLKIVNELNEDMDLTRNYKIIFEQGEIIVKQRTLVISPKDVIAVYNGEELFGNQYVIVDGTLGIGDLMEVKTDKSTSTVNNIITDNLIISHQIMKDSRDVYFNYIIYYEGEARLELTKKPITIRPKDVEKAYDGKDLISTIVNKNDDLVKNDHYILIETTGSQNTHGESTNLITSHQIFDGFGNEVTDNYEAKYEEGILKVRKRQIHIKPKDREAIYDGTEYSALDYELIGDVELILGHRIIDLNYRGSYVNAKEHDTFIDESSIIIVDENNEEVTDNYDYKFEKGTLKINKRNLTIKTGSKEFIYNRLENYNDQYSMSDSLVNNHNVVIRSDTLTKITNVGKTNNEFEVDIKDEFGNNQTDNYNIEFTYGILEVKARRLEVSLKEFTRKYDGTNDIENLEYSLLDEFEYLSLSIKGTLKSANVGKYFDAKLVTIIKDIDFEKNVTDNYDIVYNHDNYTISKRHLLIQPLSMDHIYGDEYPASWFERVDYDRLVNGHDLSIETIYENEVNDNVPIKILSHKITDVDNNDYTDNYSVEYLENTINIKHREISIKLRDISKEYDGEVLESTDYDFLDSSRPLAPGHELVLETTGSITNPGEVINEVKNFIIYDENKNDVTKNYIVNHFMGTLLIEKEIVIQISSMTRFYNGQEFSFNSEHFYFPDLDKDLISGDKLTLNVYGSLTNASDQALRSITPLDEILITRNGIDVSRFYSIKVLEGYLKVNRRKITVSSYSANKNYDGRELTNNRIKYLSGSLVNGHELDIDFLSKITEVGQVDNEYHINNINDKKTNESVMDNYDITTLYGKLTINPKAVDRLY